MVELFKIGFISVTLLDVLDIAIVSFIVYKLYNMIRGTIAAQILLGLVILLLMSFLAQAADLRALSWLLELVRDTWVIAFIVVFQPELRRLLMALGKSPFFSMFKKSNIDSVADILADASFTMAQHQHGALMVLERKTGLANIIEKGTPIGAKVNKDLIRAIFFPRAALHDGAVIIRDNIIEAARCTLPLSAKTTYDGQSLGMRHRAGLGISEQADVISIIVSEETGGISVAEDGKLTRGLSKDSLRNYLKSKLGAPKEKGFKGLKGIFLSFGKNK